MQRTDRPPPANSAARAIFLAIALTYPTVLTWLYFVQLDGRPTVQRMVFVAGKIIQFTLPVVWLLLIERRRITCHWPTRSGLAWGFASGLLIAAATLAAYFLYFQPRGLLADTATAVREKLFGMGLSSPAAIIAMSVSYSLGHSLLEEYYWRWFVFGRLRQTMPFAVATAISSLGFMAHHVILVHKYLPSWWIVAAASVALGGALWAWRYERDGSLWGPWISHMLTDAAIFAVGYAMAFR